ncbi:MAG: glutaredoxin family protein [Halieaceae bacterium]|nr:glutaredoxin family protein [Halieaceae bacterium]
MELILYHTSGCHLCELAEGVVAQAKLAGADIQLALVDIAASEDLMNRYGWTIPVLASGSWELSWPFDLAKLQSWLVLLKT